MITYKTADVCKILHTSPKTLQMLREEGALEATKGRSFLYTEDEIKQFAERFKGHGFTNREEVKEVMRKYA